MKNLINNLKLDTIKQISLIFLIITITISTIIIVCDLHEQSLLDREFGKMLIKEKKIQLNMLEDGC